MIQKRTVIYSMDVHFNESEKTRSTTRRSEDTDKLVIKFDSDNDTDQEKEPDESQPPEPVRRSRKRRQPEYYGRSA